MRTINLRSDGVEDDRQVQNWIPVPKLENLPDAIVNAYRKASLGGSDLTKKARPPNPSSPADELFKPIDRKWMKP